MTAGPWRQHLHRALLVGVVLALGGCATALAPKASAGAVDAGATASLAQRFAALQAAGTGRLYRLDPGSSSVAIHVFRAGRTAALGHNHVLSAPRFEAWLWWPERLGEAQAELRLQLADLRLDDPAQRAAIGGSFERPLSEPAIAATRANMLGAQGLDAERFPELRLSLLELAGEAPKLVARVEVGLRGASHALDVPLNLERDAAEPAALRLSGSFVLRHRDLGLQPFSIGGGLLAVQDALLIEFSLLGRELPR